MLAEFIKALAAQAVAAAGPQVKEVEPTQSFLVRNANGCHSFIGGRVPWRDHKAQDLETIAAFAERFPAASIWYSRERVVCLTNDDDRRERVSVEMILSQQVCKMMELDKARPLLSQRDFLFVLRTVFMPDAFPTSPRLIETLRQVKFESGAKVEGNIQRGKTSVGKEASAAATFLDAVPEQVTLSVPLFENSFACRSYDIACALEIYETEMRLQLFPLPGQVEAAFSHAEADLNDNLRWLLGESKTQVYYGNP